MSNCSTSLSQPHHEADKSQLLSCVQLNIFQILLSCASSLLSAFQVSLFWHLLHLVQFSSPKNNSNWQRLVQPAHFNSLLVEKSKKKWCNRFTWFSSRIHLSEHLKCWLIFHGFTLHILFQHCRQIKMNRFLKMFIPPPWPMCVLPPTAETRLRLTLRCLQTHPEPSSPPGPPVLPPWFPSDTYDNPPPRPPSQTQLSASACVTTGSISWRRDWN